MSKKEIFEDLRKMASSAIDGAINIKNDLGEMVHDHVEHFIKRMNFVTVEELETLRRALEYNQQLILDLQKRLNEWEDKSKSNDLDGTCD